MLNEIREIYRKSFGIDSEFEDLLFNTCTDTLRVLKINSKPVSFLFALPCEIKSGTKSLKATYIFAAATDENHRKKGYMAQLLEKLKAEYNGILILRPATEPLIDYYKKQGFEKFTAQDIKAEQSFLVPTNEFKALADSAEKTADGEFTVMAFNSPVDLNKLYFPYSMP